MSTCSVTGQPEIRRICVRAVPGLAARVQVSAFSDASGLRLRAVSAAGGDALTANGDCTAADVAITCPGGGLQRISMYGQALADLFDTSALPQDSFRGGLPAYMDGGAGDDTLIGSASADSVYGRDGNDTISGGTGNDVLDGGPGDDQIAYGGAAIAAGGDGVDTVTFAGVRAPVSVTLGTTGGDGAYPRYGRVASSVENVIGGEGNDTLTSTLGAVNGFDGRGGNDRINPGPGADSVWGGPGNDQITVRDGTRDSVDCGSGNDTAVVDPIDATVNCEVNSLAGVDSDRDRSPRPADCNDGNPRIRPGAPEIPQNGVDEDCDRTDAPFPEIRARITIQYRGGRVSSLVVRRPPAGTRIEVRCRARGCPFKQRVRRVRSARARVTLTSWFKRRTLRPGTVIEVRVVAPEVLGRTRRDRIGRTKITTSTRCLPPRRKSQRVGRIDPTLRPRKARRDEDCG